MEINNQQSLIVNFSDLTWATNEKSNNAQLVIDTQASYDALLVTIKTAEIALEVANQWVAAY